MLPKNTYKQHKAVITGFIDGAKKNKPALGEYLDKHYFFDDIGRTIRYTGNDSALGNLINKNPRKANPKRLCSDCKKDVYKNPRDYFLVTDEVWAKYGVGRDMLCMTCLEERMGRRLERADIHDCPVSAEWNPYTRDVLER
jgi:hypothetical protein